jgi:hypothetical protein
MIFNSSAFSFFYMYVPEPFDVNVRGKAVGIAFLMGKALSSLAV